MPGLQPAVGQGICLRDGRSVRHWHSPIQRGPRAGGRVRAVGTVACPQPRPGRSGYRGQRPLDADRTAGPLPCGRRFPTIPIRRTCRPIPPGIRTIACCARPATWSARSRCRRWTDFPSLSHRRPWPGWPHRRRPRPARPFSSGSPHRPPDHPTPSSDRPPTAALPGSFLGTRPFPCLRWMVRMFLSTQRSHAPFGRAVMLPTSAIDRRLSTAGHVRPPTPANQHGV